jgi:hypothetical protein
MKVLSASAVKLIVDRLKKERGVKAYTPYKYFDGLTTRGEVVSRFENILKGSKTKSSDPNAYKYFKTDVGRTTRKSKYTEAFFKTHPGASSMSAKSRATGIPIDILDKVYDKGYAAWRTGHRVGAGPEQWGYARIHSFALLGCTALSADSRLLKDALKRMKSKKKRAFLSQPIRCESEKLKKKYYKGLGMVEYIRKQRKAI